MTKVHFKLFMSKNCFIFHVIIAVDTIVGLTTPPHTLKMEDVRFPTVGDQSVMKPDRSNMNPQRISR